MRRLSVVLAVVAACSAAPEFTPDAGVDPHGVDASVPADASSHLDDASVDAGASDGGVTDSGLHEDAGMNGTADAGPLWLVIGGPGPVRLATVDLTTGAMHLHSAFDAGTNPSFLAIDRAHQSLYAINEGNPGQLRAFSWSEDTGTARAVNSVQVGNGPAHVSVDGTGRWVFTSNYGGGSLTVVAAKSTGGLGTVSDTRSPGTLVHQAITDPSNRFVLVPCKGSDRVAVFGLDVSTGHLSAMSHDYATKTGAGPRHVAFHPTLPIVYLVNELDSTLSALAFDNDAGVLTELATRMTLPVGSSATNTGAEVVVHPSGQWVYTSNRGHDSIAQFTVDPVTGTPQLTITVSTQGRTPRSFALDPSGHLMVVANQGSGGLATFFIDDAGTPRFSGQTLTTTSPAFVGFSR